MISKHPFYLFFFWIVFINVSILPRIPVTSVGTIRVLEESELANFPIASTCRFIISKFTAGCPFFEMASANNFVWSASKALIDFFESMVYKINAEAYITHNDVHKIIQYVW